MIKSVFIVSLEGTHHKGVIKKLLTQAKYLNELKVESKVIAITDNEQHNKSDETLIPIFVENIRLSKLFNRRFLREIKPLLEAFLYRRNMFKLLTQFVNTQLENSDVLYMRYPISDYFLFSFLRRIKQPVFFEHNTIEINELRLNKDKWPINKYLYICELIFSKYCLRLSAGSVGVTNSFTKHQIEKAKKKIKHITIGNGIDNEMINVSFCENRNETGVMILGTYNRWHGLEELTDFLNKEVNKLTIDVYGKVPLIVRQNVKSKLIRDDALNFKDSVKPDEIPRLLKKYSFGVSSLNLKLLGVEDGSPLKTREYLAAGLPVLLGYNDVDLEGMKGVFNIYEEGHYESLMKFVKNDHLGMDEVVDRIGMKNKMKLLLNFMQKTYRLKTF